MPRFTSVIDKTLPIIAIDLGYSAKSKSCGIAYSKIDEFEELEFGECIRVVESLIRSDGPHLLILEAVLSTYHQPNGNPAIRGDFEKGRGWYHGPGVTTFAAALRFLRELDRALPVELDEIPLIEGFLSYKTTKTAHSDDAKTMIRNLDHAEVFHAKDGSEPICPLVDSPPEIRRYNPPLNAGRE